MLLQEEYIKRHSIDVLPIVHTNFGSVIFRHDEFRYLVVHLEWVPYYWRVGHFKIWIYRPIHNGHIEGGKLFSLYDEITIEWNNYQSFFSSWISFWCNEIKPVMQHESLMACWEIFLYCFDGWLARNASSEFMKLIDKTFSNQNRIGHIQDAHGYLRLNHQVIANKFENAILAHSTNYMEWVSDLLKNNIEKSNLAC